MDPFEEFEFKPLTEGLGFHKKAETPNVAEKRASATPASVSQSSLANQEPARQKSKSITDLIAALPPSLDFFDEVPAEQASTERATSSGTPAKTTSTDFKKSLFGETATEAIKPAPQPAQEIEPEARPQIFQPLGRKEYSAPAAQATSAAAAAMSSLTETKKSSGNMVPPAPTLKSSLSGSTGSTDYSRSFPHLDKKSKEPKEKIVAPAAQPAPIKAAPAVQPGLRKVSSSFSAAILDAMVITGFATIFLVSILVITEVDLIALLSNAATDIGTYMNLVGLFFVVMHLYILSSRGVFGATLGEWAFDMQLGTNEEQKSPGYYPKLIWRMVLMAVTGFVILPILSKLSRRDLAASMGASQLYVRG